MAPLTATQKRAQKKERAQKLLNGAKLRAKDQGSDDDVWEWIYQGATTDAQDGDEDSAGENTGTPSRKRKRKATKDVSQTIVGARRGDFECMVGDTVLVSNDNGMDWAAIICYFFEMDGEPSAEMMCTRYFCLDLWNVG